MLVLSRKIGEQILIPELNITLTVLSAGPNRVQLGIKAPRTVNITRPEIAERCQSRMQIGAEASQPEWRVAKCRTDVSLSPSSTNQRERSLLATR